MRIPFIEKQLFCIGKILSLELKAEVWVLVGMKTQNEGKKELFLTGAEKFELLGNI